MDENAIITFLRSPATPLWALFLVVIVSAVRSWPSVLERWNERTRDRVTERAGDWTRLRDEVGRLAERVHSLEDACDMLSKKVRECEEREMTWMQRAIKAESLLLGQGEVRQSAAVATAEIRLDAADKANKERKADKP